jgi:hypothetical protein
MKHCLLIMCDILCPDKKGRREDFQSVSLSCWTFTSRIESISKNLTTLLTHKIEKSKLFLITMDECMDISDTAHLHS